MLPELIGVFGANYGCKNIIIADIDPVLILELIEKKNTFFFFVPAVILF